MARRASARVGATQDAGTDALEDDSHSGRQFITALARGLDVLGAFRAGDPPLSNQELAKRCNLPRPTISRMTHTLTELGYLSYHEGFGCYELGGAMLTLGHVAKGSFEALETAVPLMGELAELSNANVGIGCRDRLTMLYMLVCKAPSGIGLRFEAGSKVPIIQTAMGRAYIAALDDDDDLAALTERLLKRHAGEQDMVRRVIEESRDEYARHGFCISAGNWFDDVNGIAAPIPRLSSGGDALVLNCGAPASLMSPEHMRAMVGPRLVETAKTIGEMLEAAAPSKST